MDIIILKMEIIIRKFTCIIMTVLGIETDLGVCQVILTPTHIMV